MAGGRWTRRLRVRHDLGDCHAALPRTATVGAKPTFQPLRAGQRLSRLARDTARSCATHAPSLLARRTHRSGRADRRVHCRTLAHGSLRDERGLDRDPGDVRTPRQPHVGDELSFGEQPPRRQTVFASVPIGARFSRVAAREFGLPFRARTTRVAPPLLPLSQRAPDRHAEQWQLRARTRMVPQLPLCGRRAAWAGLRRRSCRPRDS